MRNIHLDHVYRPQIDQPCKVSQRIKAFARGYRQPTPIPDLGQQFYAFRCNGFLAPEDALAGQPVDEADRIGDAEPAVLSSQSAQGTVVSLQE